MRGTGFLSKHKTVIFLTVLGLAFEIAYTVNSYYSSTETFFHHLGGNLFDHILILLILPLLFVLGLFADRSRSSQDDLEKLLERETHISQLLQSVFYPQITPIAGYQFSARYQPVLEESELGGDFYDVFSLGDEKTVVTMADVSGKGLRSAIVGAFTKSLIRAYFLEGRPLTEAAALISSAVHHEYDPDIFVTAFIGVLDKPSGVLRYVNAGHPGPLYISEEKTVDILSAASMPLGVFAQQEFVEGEVALAPGDFLVLYTDGLYEFRTGEEAAPETVARDVRSLLPADAETLVERLLAGAVRQANGEFNDDVAILALQRKA